MQNRDEQILNHIGRYRVSLRAVMEKLFFNGGTSDHVIQRLTEEKRIQTIRQLPGRLSYYQLTLTEARHRGVPEDRAKKRTSYSLREAIAILWFCCMTTKTRRRIDPQELPKYGIPETGTTKPHCAEVFGEEAVVYRIFAPSPGARDDYLMLSLRRDAISVLENPELKEWALAGTYGFAVLFETEGRLKRFERRVRFEAPFPIRLYVELVPSLHRLAHTIKRETPSPLSSPTTRPT